MRTLFIIIIILIALLSHLRILGNEQKGKAKHRKPKIKMNTLFSEQTHKYGTDLPSFSFDYSEFFSTAIIERSFKQVDLHLVMFLVGQKAISIEKNGPFQSLSTEEEVLHSWGEASKKWILSDHIHRAFSGLYCVIQANIHSHNRPYLVPAYWTPLHSKTNEIFRILRCKLKHSHSIYQNITSLLDKSIFVDIVRKQSKHPHHSLKTNETTNFPSKSTVPTEQAHITPTSHNESESGPHHILISFNVPWSTRQTGYPFLFHRNSSNFEPWQDKTKSNEKKNVEVNSDNLISAHEQDVDSLIKADRGLNGFNSNQKFGLCAYGLRPLNLRRAEVGLPMLVEFVSHHLNLGFDHIFMGLQLDWNSISMYKHLHVLNQYIKSGKLTLTSMSQLKGFDDVAGFAGIQVKDSYSDLFFLNQCLYHSKGVFDFIIPLKASQFIIPGEKLYQNKNLSDQTIIQSLFQEAKKAIKYNNTGVFSTDMNKRRILMENDKTLVHIENLISNTHKRNPGRSADTLNNFIPKNTHHSRHGHTNNQLTTHSIPGRLNPPHPLPSLTQNDFSVVCGIEVNAGFVISDPPNTLFGPGDSWSQDYFKGSKPIPFDKKISFWSTESTNFIDIKTSIEPSNKREITIKGFCPHLKNQIESIIQLPIDIVGFFKYQEIKPNISSNKELDKLSEKYDNTFQQMSTSLVKELGSVNNLRDKARESVHSYKVLLNDGKLDNGAKLKMASRHHLKPPFWQSCTDKNLTSAIARVFHSV